VLAFLGFVVLLVQSGIVENNRNRREEFTDTNILHVSSINGIRLNWITFPPNASEISYKGRWDSKHISCKLT
jgi:hypothetical protein